MAEGLGDLAGNIRGPAFTLQLNKIEKNFSQGSQKMLGTVRSVQLSVFLQDASKGLLIPSRFQLSSPKRSGSL